MRNSVSRQEKSQTWLHHTCST
jgi:hypothetical protein